MVELDTDNIFLVMRRPYTNYCINDEDFDPLWCFTKKKEAQNKIDDVTIICKRFRDYYYIITFTEFLEEVKNLKQRYDDLDVEREDYE